jgi:hypothetical protein
MKQVIVIAIAALCFASGGAAQPFDAVVVGHAGACAPITPVTFPQLEWLGGDDPDVLGTDLVALAPGPQGRIYGLSGERNERQLVRVRRDSIVPFATIPAGHTALGLVLDAQGNIYVLGHIGAGGYIIDVFAPDGSFRDTLPLSGGDYSGFLDNAPLDLAADQCTLFLIQNETTIRRFNVCTGTFLADFATVPNANSVRILPDGGVLVASGNTIVRLDSNGVPVRTYARPSWSWVGPITLAGEGTTLWLAEDGCETSTADHLDLAIGTLLASHPLNQEAPHSIVPWQAWTAAIGTGGASGAAEVPAASTWGLIALAGLTVIAAIRRIG